MSGLRRMRTGISCTDSTGHGLTAPRASNSRRWSSWRNFRRSCLCRVPTWYATEAAWRRTANAGPRSFPHRASRVWMAKKRRPEPRIGTGQGCSAASSMWRWRPVFRHGVGGGSLATFRCAAVAPCAPLLPFFRHCVGGGSLATFTQESVITRILRHLKLASVPPPIAPARCRQELCVFDEVHASVGPHGFLSCTLWQLGSPDQAMHCSREALTLAEEVLHHPIGLANALFWTAILHQCRREETVAYEQAAALKTLATEHGFPQWLAWGTVLHGGL